MIDISGRTVREVAMAIPQATRVFEKLNIDYCCGGQKPLTEACASAGIEINNLVKLLNEVESEKPVEGLDWQNVPLSELASYIVDKHHVFTKSELVRLEALVSKVVGVHGENHPELREIGKILSDFSADLQSHMFKEEAILFPFIAEMELLASRQGRAPHASFGTVANPISMMMREHDIAGDLLKKMRDLSSNYTLPADACISYQTLYQTLEALEKDLHQHIHLENNILFPRTLDLEAGR